MRLSAVYVLGTAGRMEDAERGRWEGVGEDSRRRRAGFRSHLSFSFARQIYEMCHDGKEQLSVFRLCSADRKCCLFHRFFFTFISCSHDLWVSNDSQPASPLTRRERSGMVQYRRTTVWANRTQIGQALAETSPISYYPLRFERSAALSNSCLQRSLVV